MQPGDLVVFRKLSDSVPDDEWYGIDIETLNKLDGHQCIVTSIDIGSSDEEVDDGYYSVRFPGMVELEAINGIHFEKICVQ